MSEKNPSALDYLATYGWMLMVVIIVIASLVFSLVFLVNLAEQEVVPESVSESWRDGHWECEKERIHISSICGFDNGITWREDCSENMCDQNGLGTWWCSDEKAIVLERTRNVECVSWAWVKNSGDFN